MDAEALRKLVPELMSFVGRFEDCFVDRRCREHLPVYVQGQLSDLDRKSVEPIALKAGIAPRTLQEFLSLLSWDQDRMRDRVQQIVAAEHAGPNSVGLIDETSFVKKGTKTPGVQRQWCGHIGKVENCVATVHLGYTQGDFQCLLDGDLFLPKSWDEDRERCAEAGIPQTVVYRAKWKIALEQYDRALVNDIHFDWLTFDEYYGGKPEFRKELSDRKQKWVAEVPKNLCGWLTLPRITTRPYLSGKRSRRHLKPRLVKGEPTVKRLDLLLKRHPKLRDQSWKQYRFDDREQGPSVWEAKHALLYPFDDGLPGKPTLLVVARHVLRLGDVKYFLADAPPDTPTEAVLWVGLTRHRVERCFQDQKSELGLDHFEGRKYVGLKRHLSLTLVSYLFLMRAAQQRGGEKSGVDRSPSTSGRLVPDYSQVATRPHFSGPTRTTEQRNRVHPAAQRQSSPIPQQTHPTTPPPTRNHARRHETMRTT
jgi:SRSO17 transposase